MASARLPYAIAAIVLFAAAFFLYFPVAADHPYAYDEADYMWAGKQGFLANYLDRNGLSFPQFVRKGLELSRDSSKRQSFSQHIRSTGDIGMYRHYHGPVYAYWLSLLHKLGVTSEHAFRGSGLAIHLATATLILLGFWRVFPGLPPLAGLAAAGLFVFNRTALTAAVSITQHVAFTFLSVATLLAASCFLQALEAQKPQSASPNATQSSPSAARWLYATMALLALSFATVETSILLVAALALSLLIERRRLRREWPTLRSFAVPLAKGLGVFVITMFVCWPAGVAQLGLAKGFLTLLYISVYRRTFTPLSPLGLWAAKFEASPWEFSLLLLGVVAALVFWRRSSYRSELTPWVAFSAVFFVIMLKITVPYTYYYGSLTAAFAVVTGFAFGALWNRSRAPWRFVLPIAIAASIAGTTVDYHEVVARHHEARPYHIAVLKLLAEQPVPAGRLLYVPYQLVPTLHYYHSDLATAGYDLDYPVDAIAAGAASAQAADSILCERSMCRALERYAPGFAEDKTLLDPSGPNQEPFYLVRVRKRQGGL